MSDEPAVDYDDPATEMAEVEIDELTDEIVTEIERPRQGDPTELGANGYMDPHTLPGFGEPYDDCNEPIPYFCTCCGDTFSKGRRCKRSVCKECAPLWDVDRAEADLARLNTVAKVMGAEMGESVKMHHLVFIPPSANDETDHEWYLDADDPIKRTREVVAAILKALNAEGLVYYHGWSGEQGDDRGEWKDRQFSGRDFEGDVRTELKPRPHFHVICVSPFVAGGQITKAITEQTGWVIERIADDDDGKSLPDLHAAASAITYCLSHTSIRLNYGANGENRVIKAAYGKKWHSDTVNVRNNSRREAERAVRAVAPRTLGISPSELRCETDVPLNERDERVEVGDAYDDADTDADLDPDDAASGTDSASSDDDCCDDDHDDTPVETVQCKGVIKPLSEADEYLNDDDWVSQTLHSEQLRRRYQDFQAQAQLDNPPPMVAAFA